MVSTTKSEIANSLSLRAQTVCARAREFEEAGDFEKAREAISEFWQRIGDPPRVEGLSDVARADVFLHAGVLSGYIGSTRQITGAQAIAKDLISKSAGEFERLGLVERVAEARIDLGICYWREGAFDEARITLDDALMCLGDMDSEQRLRAFLNKAIIEEVSNRGREALRLHRQAAPLFEVSTNRSLQGKFHNAYALVLKNLGLAENREDYLDQALIEFSAASFHFEQARHKRSHSVVENNLGYLFVRLGRFAEAQVHLSRARAVATSLKDQALVAQFDDSRARAFIAEGQFSKAEAVARSAVQVLQEGDELSLLATSLTTLGTALARLGNYSKARAALEKAIAVAQQAGDSQGGGVAALSMAEELANHLPFDEIVSYYRMAESELINSRNSEVLNRLGACARLLLSTESLPASERSISAEASASPEAAQLETTFALEATLDEQVLRYEGELIKQALEAAEGSITRAARMLGVTHQGLAFILNGRQKNLLPSRKPAKPRRRSIIRFH
jgi:tetratricopeptide (TPR) repeat protein